MQKGFTMFELTITISIMVMVAALVLVNFPQYNRRVAMGRAAQEISLTLRKAQARALAVQKFVATGQFPQGYGVFFTRASDKEYILFADLDENNLYTAGEAVETIALPTPLLISNLLAKEKTASPGTSLHELHIVFYRPDPVIVMSGRSTPTSPPADLLAGDVEIVLSTPEASFGTRKVVAWTTGQVSVEE
ncbi:MAG: type II secretion system protein [Patescibacteria group bacterium]